MEKEIKTIMKQQDKTAIHSVAFRTREIERRSKSTVLFEM